MTVWAKRREATIRDLCNVPVYLWVWWGEEHVVLKQVERAMNTWCSRQDTSEQAAYATADKLLADLSHAKLPGALRDLLAQALRGKRPDVDQLRSNLHRAVDRNIEVAVGSAMPIDVGADMIVDLIVARITAIERLPTVNDATWEWARFTVLRGTLSYAHDQPQLATHKEFGHLFASLDHDTLVARACVTLLTTLGMALVARTGTPGTLEDPVFWHEHGLKGAVTNTRLNAQGIALTFIARKD